jgi:3-methylfumaryl-CoA hydratase
MTAWTDWIDREEVRSDVLTPGLAARYAATLDARPSDDAAPQGIHWCLGLPDTLTGELGADGHPPKGGLLPPVDQPRRMWASSDVEFVAPIAVGAAIERTSRVVMIDEKSGSAGALVFVTVLHETKANGVMAVRETQTIVYRDAPAAAAAAMPNGDLPRPDGWSWHRGVTPTAPMLFRYSALTFNTHRIHYDLPYAAGEEGYPGLVVHGPLMASLLLDLTARVAGPNRLKRFQFRGKAPAFAGLTLHLLANEERGAVTYAIIDQTGREIMAASGVLVAAW